MESRLALIEVERRVITCALAVFSHSIVYFSSWCERDRHSSCNLCETRNWILSQLQETKADLDICPRFCNSMQSDAQVHCCQIDLAQEAQQAKKETQHRRDEQQGHRNRRIKAQEGAQEENRDHGAHEERRRRT
jgi:hypothetical protein